jgi:mRNA interferase RelE/StbE
LTSLDVAGDDDGVAQVKATSAALKQLAKLPPTIRERIGKLFQRLQAWPAVSGAKPLSGDLAGWYRLRTGDYRLRFRVEGETVIVAKIGHRSEFYED